MEGYDEPDADSDFDYEESAYSKRRSKTRKNAAKVLNLKKLSILYCMTYIILKQN